MRAVLPAIARPLLAPHLPADLDIAWFTSADEARTMIADAEIAWVDMEPAARVAETIRAAGPALRWVFTLYAGLDAFPLDLLRERGVTLTNGVGVTAQAVAEYATMGVLAAAKRFDEVVRARDRHEWPNAPPGRTELAGTRALVIGYGAIGAQIGRQLAAFDVAVTPVTRSGRDGSLTSDAWRARLGEFDWVILAAPSTAETRAMIGAEELAAMKPSAWLINIARGDMIDTPALIDALTAKRIAGAFLDPTDPEPLPAAHPLWSAPNAMITMHLSARSSTGMFQRAAALFARNLAAWREGRPMENVVDLAAGY